jgi:hypothetical protein
MEKRGQFYLIATIIITAIIVGFAAVVNYSEEKTPVKIQELGEELKIESEKILDYCTYNNLDETEMENLLINFIGNYSKYSEEKDLYFIFGDRSKITVIVYQESGEEIYVDVGDGNELLTMSGGTGKKDFNPILNEVTITVKGTEYNFEIKSGENFYFIISQEIEGEQYVVTN